MPDNTMSALLSDVEKDLGMEEGALALDEDGQSIVQIDEDGTLIAMDYIDSQDVLVLSSVLDPLPEDQKAEAYKAMLKSNFLWQDTYGATLCLEPNNGLPMLMHQVDPEGLIANDLIDLIEGMADLAQKLNEALETAGDPGTAAETSVSTGGEDFIRG